MGRAISILTENYLLSVALISWLAAQICKTILDFILSGKLDLERSLGSGLLPHDCLCAKIWGFFAVFRLCLCARRNRHV